MKFHPCRSLDYRTRQRAGRKVMAAKRAGALAITGQAVWPDGRIGWAAITFDPAEEAEIHAALRAHPVGPPTPGATEGAIPPARVRFERTGPAFVTGWLGEPGAISGAGQVGPGAGWVTQVRY